MKKISFVKFFYFMEILILFGASIGFYMHLEGENPSGYNLLTFPIIAVFFLIINILFPIKRKEKSRGKP